MVFDPIAKNADLYALKDGQFYMDQKAQTEHLRSYVLPDLTLHLKKIFKDCSQNSHLYNLLHSRYQNNYRSQ